MTSKDQMAMPSPNESDDLLERLWAYDDVAAAGNRPAGDAAGLVNLRYIGSALRRTVRFWGGVAIAGLLAGLALYAAAPPAHQASTSVFLVHGPNAYPPTAIANDEGIAQSRSVAELALHSLGLRQSLGSFHAAYTVSAVSDRVLVITVTAPSGNDAITRANVLAKAFLQFRADQLQTERNLTLSTLDGYINQAKQHLSSINTRIGRLAAQPASSSQRANLSYWRSQRSQAAGQVTVLEQAYENTFADPATAAAADGSRVLDSAALVPHSRFKQLLFYAVTGLLAGLTVGVSLVVVLALTSDRLRRRDDVAQALGAPVKLSVGPVRASRWRPGRHEPTAGPEANIGRIAAHLSRAVPASSQGAAALAVVPVDDPHAASLSLVSLAVSCAREGSRVVLADLCRGAPMASLLGVTDPGVHAVTARDARLTVAVPDRDDPVPAGPHHQRDRRPSAPGPSQALPSHFTEAVTVAGSSADLLLTLAPLDPSLGSEHLSSWASAAVAVVTAGRSSATKISAAGEMIRLAGTRLVSCVLVGADKADDSLGVTSAPSAGGAGQGGHLEESERAF